MNKIIHTALIGLLGCSALASFANTVNNDKNKSSIIFIDDLSDVLDGKQMVLFRENQTKGSVSAVANNVIKNVQPNPDVKIKITYKVESDFANQVASQVNSKVFNQIYIEKCCRLDSSRVNLKGSQIDISYYK